MHKLCVLFLLVACYRPDVYSQEKPSYHLFYFNNKTGITDTAAKELLPPSYRCYNSKNELVWVMVQSDTSCVLFNTADGMQKRYKHTEPYAAKLDDGYYMNVQQHHGPSLLINSKTGTTIELGRIYDGFQREDRYLFATYYLPGSTIKNHKTRRLDVLDLQNKFKPVVSSAYASVQRLYRIGTVQKNELSQVPFDAVLFSLYHQHQLYDKSMKLIKNFTSEKTGSQDLAQICSHLLQYQVLPSYKELPPQPVGLAELDRASLPPPPTAKLMSKKIDDSTILVYLQRKGQDDLPLFTTTINTLYVSNNQVDIFQVNDQFMKTAEAVFDVDLTTGRCMLPQSYWKRFNMTPVQ